MGTFRVVASHSILRLDLGTVELVPLRLLLLPLSVLRVVGRALEPSERAREPRVNVERRS